MHLKALVLLSFYCLLSLTPPPAIANPRVAFPINSQLPPVAIASQEFNFTFSAESFSSNKQILSYKVLLGPKWLSLNIQTRTLTGTPSATDVGACNFQLVANDEDGEVLDSVTLVILQTPSIELGRSILPQLEEAGRTSIPASLLLHPLQRFSINFSLDAFSNVSSSTIFYVVSTDDSPLPSWAKFDDQDLIFSGVSPPLRSPDATQQIYGFKLIATNVPGFAEVAIQFQINVSYHVLSFSSAVQTLHVSPGNIFQTPSLIQRLTLDNLPISKGRITSMTAETPGWVHFGSEKWCLIGSLPDGVLNASITVSATDIYGDVARASVLLLSSEAGSPNDFPPSLTAVIGRRFSHGLNLTALKFKDSNMKVDLGDAANWLQFSAQSLTLYGTVPTNLIPQTIHIWITFENGNDGETFHFAIHLVAPNNASSSVSTTRTSDITQSSVTDSSRPAESSTTPIRSTHSSKNRLLAILLPVTLTTAATVVILYVWYYLRLRKQRELDYHDHVERDHSQDIHRPSVGPESGITGTQILTQAKVPRIELNWPQDSLERAKNLLSKTSNLGRPGSKNSKLSNPIESSTGSIAAEVLKVSESFSAGDLSPSSQKSGILATWNSSSFDRGSRAASISPKNFQKLLRESKAPSYTYMENTAFGNRLSGFGHGSGISAYSENLGQVSRQNTMRFISVPRSKPNPVFFHPFPLPSRNENSSRLSQNAGGYIRSRSRLIRSSIGENELSGTQGQRWHAQYAREQLEGATLDLNARPKGMGSRSKPAWNGYRHSTAPFTISSDEKYNSIVARRSTIGSSMGIPSPKMIPTVESLLFDHRGFGQELSTASSRQFDSAQSSDSQWEDEDITPPVKDDNKNIISEYVWSSTATSHHFRQVTSSSSDPRKSRHQLREQSYLLCEPGLARQADSTTFQKSHKSPQSSVRFI